MADMIGSVTTYLRLFGCLLVGLMLAGMVHAHPGGHWHMTNEQTYLHALDLQQMGRGQAATDLIEQLAQRGHRPSQFEAYRQGDEAQREPLLWRVAGPQHPSEQYRLGEKWLHGDGVDADPSVAAFWFAMAARQGHTRAQVMLASQLFRGDGVAASEDQGLALLQQAARQGSTEAQFRLGRRLQGQAGRRWIERAATGGHSQAQHYLGLQLTQGGEYPKDEALAREWLIRAAQGGHVTSMLLSGMMLAEGRGGNQDDEAAYQWLLRVQRSGDARADQQLQVLEKRLGLKQADTVTTATTIVGSARVQHSTAQTITEMLGYGTGFWLNSAGLLVTNFHVIDQCSEIRIPGKGVAVVVMAEPDNDLAVLRTERFSEHWIALAEQPASIGQSIRSFSLSHPDTDFEEIAVHDGKIQALERPGSDRRYFRFDARLERGHSGAPVVDVAGRAVGLVVAKLTAPAAYRLTGAAGQPVSFALHSELIRGLLLVYGIDPDGAESGADPARAIARVECWY
jgi:TPR repeat protein